MRMLKLDKERQKLKVIRLIRVKNIFSKTHICINNFSIAFLHN